MMSLQMKLPLFALFPAALSCLAACEKKPPTGQTPSAGMPSATASVTGAAPSVAGGASATSDVKVSPMKTLAEADVPKDIKVPGKVVKAISFSDKNGENFVVFAKQTVKKKDQVNSAYLTVEHVAHPDGVRKSLRTVRDKDEDCDLDQTLEFREGALSVTDLDNDGIGEVTFAYVVSCKSDVSPDTLKLLMIENGDKYILRGSSRVDGVGGEYKIDPSFNAGPPAFLEHAKKQWKKVKAAE
jgi:hypothetical protein